MIFDYASSIFTDVCNIDPDKMDVGNFTEEEIEEIRTKSRNEINKLISSMEAQRIHPSMTDDLYVLLFEPSIHRNSINKREIKTIDEYEEITREQAHELVMSGDLANEIRRHMDYQFTKLSNEEISELSKKTIFNYDDKHKSLSKKTVAALTVMIACDFHSFLWEISYFEGDKKPPVVAIKFKDFANSEYQKLLKCYEFLSTVKVALIPKDERLPLFSVKNLKKMYGFGVTAANYLYNALKIEGVHLPTHKRAKIQTYLLDPEKVYPKSFVSYISADTALLNPKDGYSYDTDCVMWSKENCYTPKDLMQRLQLKNLSPQEIVDAIDEDSLIKAPLSYWKALAKQIYTENLTDDQQPWDELPLHFQQRLIVNTIRHNGVVGYVRSWLHDDDRRQVAHNLAFEKLQKMIANEYPYLRNEALRQIDRLEERNDLHDKGYSHH